MEKQSGRDLLGWVLSIILSVTAQAWAVLPTNENSDVLLSTMQQELQRAQSSLGKLDPAPYFLSYSVYDQSVSNVVGSQGALIGSTHVRRRSADVTMRIGTPALDNRHGNERKSAIRSGVPSARRQSHEELVRGASFGDLDPRALRGDLVAAGDDIYIDNRPTLVPQSIVAPSILFDELVVKRANTNKERLPEYPAPTVGAQ